MVGMSDYINKKVTTLSGGEQQRICITTIPDNLNCYLTYHSDDISNNYKEECEFATDTKGVGAVLGLTDLSLYSMNMNSNNDMP